MRANGESDEKRIEYLKHFRTILTHRHGEILGFEALADEVRRWRHELTEIREAIRRIDEGTYGWCEDCWEEIRRERLMRLPWARRCIDCQRESERHREHGAQSLGRNMARL